MTDLYDLLACPDCRGDLSRGGPGLVCVACAREFPVIGRVPILLPKGGRPATANEHELHVRSGYDPWLHRVVLESLPPGGVALEIGAGSMSLSVPNVIRLDVGLTPYVDVVGDSHALPFRDGCLDFVFSLAVVEHLERPHEAATQMHRVLKDGGLVYGECSFVFPYHGYPHHYFNATHQGLARVFGAFAPLRRGVAPYQMPSFAVRGVLEAWANDLAGVSEAATARELVQRLLAEPLGALDQRLAPQGALRCAAGTYFLGVKHGDRAARLPDELRGLLERTAALHGRSTTRVDPADPGNVLRWARDEGRRTCPEIDAYFARADAFRKHAGADDCTAALLGLGPGFAQVAGDAAMEGWLDGVVGGDAPDALKIGGWAADATRGAPVAGVEVWIDDAACIPATIGGERADVVAVSGRSDYRLSGWTALLPLDALAPGPHHVAAFAYGVHGSRAKLSGERTIDVPPRA
jgi:uncharacterized protein YbaR (Trm112 family)/SAM-dependent methyltransferase